MYKLKSRLKFYLPSKRENQMQPNMEILGKDGTLIKAAVTFTCAM